MTAALRAAALVVLGLASLGLGCDRDRHRKADTHPQQAPSPPATGNVNQALGVNERIVPTLPTPQDRFLLAVRGGDREAAARWLGEGASAEDGAVLVAAVRGKGDLELIEWLVGRGARIGVPDDAGRTPLSWAAGEGSLPEVDYLLKKGADVQSTDKIGRTPLHFAVFSGESAVVERLLAASAAVDAQDSLGSTPLMYACSKNQAQIVKMLLKEGADPSVRDKLGRNAEERAHGENNPCAALSQPD